MKKIILLLCFVYISLLFMFCEREKFPLSNVSEPEPVTDVDTVSVPEEPAPEPITGLNSAYLPLKTGNVWTYEYVKEIKSGVTSESWDIYGEMDWTVIDSALIDTLEYYAVDAQVAGISIHYFFDNPSIEPDTNFNYSDSKQFQIVKYDTVIYEIQYETSWNLSINNYVLENFSQITTDTLYIRGTDYYPYYEVTNVEFVKEFGISFLEWGQGSNSYVYEALKLKDFEIE